MLHLLVSWRPLASGAEGAGGSTISTMKNWEPLLLSPLCTCAGMPTMTASESSASFAAGLQYTAFVQVIHLSRCCTAAT